MRLHSSQRKRTGPFPCWPKGGRPAVSLGSRDMSLPCQREEGQGEVGVNESPAGGKRRRKCALSLTVRLLGAVLPTPVPVPATVLPAVAARHTKGTSSTMATTRGPKRRHILRSACGRGVRSPSSTVNWPPRSTGPRCPNRNAVHVLSAAARNLGPTPPSWC
ncbi:hypothetical protein GWK47_006653 [Chionoecetes opilio]|uniref:Uncharacterized protein n=1 Tax=Chionoecetes opilio TaxID=41210 RepID=A0A8J5CFW5_CHIOP|nr:hypothetical protein GWK47_006653 [Chionoecetes opilio]